MKINLGKTEDLGKVSMDLMFAGIDINKAINNEYDVELRVTDVRAALDLTIKTILQEVIINEESKNISIKIKDMTLSFTYKEFFSGNEKPEYSKFYFKSENVTVGFVIKK